MPDAAPWGDSLYVYERICDGGIQWSFLITSRNLSWVAQAYFVFVCTCQLMWCRFVGVARPVYSVHVSLEQFEKVVSQIDLF